ncbi:MAG: hypothetical protein LBG43_11700 [Treponema sp.]|jgi:hypothetical protein|nr:hypothetical protein [Treponema sp.]
MSKASLNRMGNKRCGYGIHYGVGGINRGLEFQQIVNSISQFNIMHGKNYCILNEYSLKVLKQIPDHSVGLILTDPPTIAQKNIGLVQQPGWLSHKSRGFGVFFAKVRQIRPFFSGSCSITEVIEQLYCK